MKDDNRTVKQVMKQKCSVVGCCERHADNMACDCLAEAKAREQAKRQARKPKPPAAGVTVNPDDKESMRKVFNAAVHAMATGGDFTFQIDMADGRDVPADVAAKVMASVTQMLREIESAVTGKPAETEWVLRGMKAGVRAKS